MDSTGWELGGVYLHNQTHPGIDGGKVNYLDPDLMEVFIPMVHEQYAHHFGDKVGYSSGVFVDNEGDYGWQMAWSGFLAVKYKEIKKRDIRPWLPLLTEKDQDGIYESPLRLVRCSIAALPGILFSSPGQLAEATQYVLYLQFMGRIDYIADSGNG